jgi:hypothetical protein
LSHTPSNGKVVIMFGPHVGISDDGLVGKVERLGKEKLSGSCGAALGALGAIKAEREAKAKEEAAAKEAGVPVPTPSLPPPAPSPSKQLYIGGKYITLPKPVTTRAAAPAPAPPPPPPPPAPPKKQSVMDNQEEYIIRKLRPRLTTPVALSVSAAAMPAFVTIQMYDLVKELLAEELKEFWSKDTAWDSINEIVLLGGIVINRGQFAGSIESREDYFQPLVFESYTKPSGGGQPKPSDMFAETFGARADSWFD